MWRGITLILPEDKWPRLGPLPSTRGPAQGGVLHLDRGPSTKEVRRDMAQYMEYLGYTIESVPRQSIQRESWQLRIVIVFEDDRGVQRREFQSDTFYLTEQDADLHGIAFGQRLIDGKVDGQSVADMKGTERRATPRFPVRFCSTFTVDQTLEGKGIILDLSTGGCRVESPIRVESGMTLELHIHVSDFAWPIIVSAASVQWVSGPVFGLAFFAISRAERQRLDQVIKHLMDPRAAA